MTETSESDEKKNIFQRLQENYDITKFHIGIFLILSVMYFITLKLSQTWIITRRTIEMYKSAPA